MAKKQKNINTPNSTRINTVVMAALFTNFKDFFKEKERKREKERNPAARKVLTICAFEFLFLTHQTFESSKGTDSAPQYNQEFHHCTCVLKMSYMLAGTPKTHTSSKHTHQN